MIDTHAHLDMAAYKDDREQVITRALTSGINTIITVGIDLESSREAIRLAEQYPDVRATVGFHPHEAARLQPPAMATLTQLAAHPWVVAIGETGLDFYRNRSPREAQLSALQQQLELAATSGLPVVIHCRQAEADMLSILSKWAATAKTQPIGVIHCFSGDLATARRYLDMGFFISFGGYISYPSSRHLHPVIAAIPDHRIVVETDCPFLPPQRHRGRRNEPAYLPETIAVLAKIRRASPDTIISITDRNARHLFRLTEPGG